MATDIDTLEVETLEENDIEDGGGLSKIILEKTGGGREMVDWWLGLLRAGNSGTAGKNGSGKGTRNRQVYYQGLKVKLMDKKAAANWLSDRCWGKPLQPEITKFAPIDNKDVVTLRKEIAMLLGITLQEQIAGGETKK